MKKSYIGAIFLLSASVLANPYKSEFVDVSIQVQEGKETFQLICQPKVTIGELPKNWVDVCNDIGKKLLELAVESGVTVGPVDKAFGLAGDLVQKVSSDLPENIVPTQIISREFGG
ncbi:hypothetical protein [Aeromonas salmonicida]|uniref:hypothetical protein n=1 Tax=Aeromonas salmonicida TaxID=645 RepID=UPI0024A9EFD1|nr:hypothetical protein [Aeromonas salmonicida]MDM5137379.1 hypothetical protein [Aeromonas salmonicida]WHF39656.1 hypothetical protein QJ050_12700 [Aeromonas salmonicida]